MNTQNSSNPLTDRTSLKKYIQKKLEAYVQSISSRDPKKNQFYKCPFCGNEEHKNSTGGAFSIASDKIHWKCFSCNKGGDIFDLIGYQYGIKSGSSDRSVLADEYKKELAKACEIFGLNEDLSSAPEEKQTDTQPDHPITAATPETPETDKGAEAGVPHEGMFKDYLEKCHQACVPGSRGYEYLTGRGLSPETIGRFLLGYDSENDRITIPYDLSCSYYATRTIEGKTFRKPPTEIAGEEPVFNVNALYTDRFCFVCESQLDAISCMQAGGTAVAVGGTGLQKLINTLERRSATHCMILCFDNDLAGQSRQRDAANRLKELGIPFIEARFSSDQYEGPTKDMNDLLLSNADQLKADVVNNMYAAKNHELVTGSFLYPVGEYEELFKQHMTAQRQRISTGFIDLDKVLYGGLMNELYILSADTSIGKSAISVYIAQNIAASGIDVLYYALEMSRDEFIARGTSMISREENKNPIPYGEILNFMWDDSAKEFYRRSYTDYEKYAKEYFRRYRKHLYFIEGGFHGKTALEIAETAEAFKKEHHIDQLVIVVDYLQRLRADPNDRSQRDAMSITSAAVQVLGNLASQRHNTVIAISSISNSQKGQPVTDAAGKYSGDIRYTGGILLGWNWRGYSDVSNEDEREKTAQTCKERGYREMYLKVLKQRSGERDYKQTLFYYPAYNYFVSGEIDGAKIVRTRKK